MLVFLPQFTRCLLIQQSISYYSCSRTAAFHYTAFSHISKVWPGSHQWDDVAKSSASFRLFSRLSSPSFLCFPIRRIPGCAIISRCNNRFLLTLFAVLIERYDSTDNAFSDIPTSVLESFVCKTKQIIRRATKKMFHLDQVRTRRRKFSLFPSRHRTSTDTELDSQIALSIPDALTLTCDIAGHVSPPFVGVIYRTIYQHMAVMQAQI